MEVISLNNSARIVYEHTDFVKSMTCGLYVASGSRYESKRNAGVSHYIEHMLFKGTRTHSSSWISEELDLLGGHSDAYTTKEITAFFVRTLGKNADRAASVLTEMLSEPRFDLSDIESERGVILEEIGMYEDDPEDLAIERLSEKIYPNSSLGQPILGSRKSVAAINREMLLSYMQEKYVGSNIVASLCGNFDLNEIDKLAKRLEVFPKGKKSEAQKAIYVPSVYIKKKAFEQNHLCFMFSAYSLSEKERYGAAMLSSILGGGPSSRLFRKLREEEGLCYSVYAFSSCSIKEGILGIYTATNQDTEEKAIRAIWKEIDKIKTEGVCQTELDRVREKARNSYLMGLESTGNRSESMGRSLIYYDRVPSPDEISRAYDSVTVEEIQNLAVSLLTYQNVSFSAVGRVKKEEEYRALWMN